MFDVTL